MDRKQEGWVDVVVGFGDIWWELCCCCCRREREEGGMELGEEWTRDFE